MSADRSSVMDRKRHLIYGKGRFVVTLDHVCAPADPAGLEPHGSVFLDHEVMSGVTAL
ncbi:hypothetical protein Cs7R123_63100 [Catellatospora sp. TT07R-123]|uniref:hypothetical protein n=1 Tax=Catellatospora sp. TT07R-123 TaxID=2733863 RepID=UPI001B173DD4|nr:hypothetical protein [Catellatospora sp. TT07R-123]GHJ48968.1 hypothetical protein Cs7R123_63100 [Catellatospora sp. TT07R-123]